MGTREERFGGVAREPKGSAWANGWKHAVDVLGWDGGWEFEQQRLLPASGFGLHAGLGVPAGGTGADGLCSGRAPGMASMAGGRGMWLAA